MSRPAVPALLAPLALVMLAACSKTNDTVIVAETATPASPSASPPASASPTTPDAKKPAPEPSTRPVAPAPVILAQRRADSPELGAACSEPTACGTKQRVAIRAYHENQWKPPPAPGLCNRVALRSPAGAPSRALGGDGVTACVTNDLLYLASECIACRMPDRVVLEAVVSELTPGQLAWAQSMAHLEGPLRTSAAWDAAIKASAGAGP